jgi:hypothetical protein
VPLPDSADALDNPFRNLVGRASELLQRLDSKAKVLPKVAPQWKRQEEVFGVDSQADAREEVHRSTQRGKLSRAGSFAEVLWREMDPQQLDNCVL